MIKNVDDDIAEVDQGPVAIALAFNADGHRADLLLVIAELTTLADLGLIDRLLAWRERLVRLVFGPSPTLVQKANVTWYLGPPPPADPSRLWINEVQAIRGYAPPKVDLSAAPIIVL